MKGDGKGVMRVCFGKLSCVSAGIGKQLLLPSSLKEYFLKEES